MPEVTSARAGRRLLQDMTPLWRFCPLSPKCYYCRNMLSPECSSCREGYLQDNFGSATQSKRCGALLCGKPREGGRGGAVGARLVATSASPPQQQCHSVPRAAVGGRCSAWRVVTC